MAKEVKQNVWATLVTGEEVLLSYEHVAERQRVHEQCSATPLLQLIAYAHDWSCGTPTEDGRWIPKGQIVLLTLGARDYAHAL